MLRTIERLLSESLQSGEGKKRPVSDSVVFNARKYVNCDDVGRFCK